MLFGEATWQDVTVVGLVCLTLMYLIWCESRRKLR